MPKLTIDQKITKTQDAILKEELAIEHSKEKIKNLKAELKKLTAEKEQSFTMEILKLMKANGISQESVLKQLRGAELSSPDVAKESESVTSTNSEIGSKPENSLHSQNAEKVSEAISESRFQNGF